MESQQPKEIQIFNLIFPSYIDKLKIGDYKFERIKEYEQAFGSIDSCGDEFNTKSNIYSHQITAIVQIPSKEKKCVLPWQNKKSTQLNDILFLLSIFKGIDIFKKDWEDNKNSTIVCDYRRYQYGEQFRSSVSSETAFKDKKTGKIKTKSEFNNIPFFDGERIHIGFEKSLNQVLETISSKKWQKDYEGGYFLFLFKSAMQRQIIETSFILCWTIWEHIFAIKNRCLDDKAIQQMSGGKKISFILNKYFLKDINKVAQKKIKKICKIRNRIVHFGKKPEQSNYSEINMFIRLTEQLMAKILNLSPSNLFNSSEELNKFLSKQII